MATKGGYSQQYECMILLSSFTPGQDIKQLNIGSYDGDCKITDMNGTIIEGAYLGLWSNDSGPYINVNQIPTSTQFHIQAFVKFDLR